MLDGRIGARLIVFLVFGRFPLCDFELTIIDFYFTKGNTPCLAFIKNRFNTTVIQLP